MSRIKTISVIFLFLLTTFVFASFGNPQTTSGNRAKVVEGDDAQTVRVLLNEVHQLRLAIQQSQLSGYHTQVVIERMRSQQQTVDRLNERLRNTREEILRWKMYFPLQQTEIQNQLKLLETSVRESMDTNARQRYEGEIEVTKQRLGLLAQEETLLRERESQLTTQLQIEQAKLSELNDQLDAVQRELEKTAR